MFINALKMKKYLRVIYVINTVYYVINLIHILLLILVAH